MLVFISHATSDDAFVDNLNAELRRHGYETWVDHLNKPPAGTFWDEYVDQKLSEAKILLLVWSPHASLSKNVGIEWREFHENGKLIIPLIVRDAPLPLLIRRLQRISFVDVAQYQEQMQVLLKSLPAPSLNPTAKVELTEAQQREEHLLRLKEASEPVLTQNRSSLNPNQLLLVFPNMPPRMMVIDLNREKLFIGRGLDADINLRDFGGEENGVSRQHALIMVSSSGLSLMDLNSANGTFIERRRLPPQVPIPLRNDSLIQLGTLVIRVFFESIVI